MAPRARVTLAVTEAAPLVSASTGATATFPAPLFDAALEVGREEEEGATLCKSQSLIDSVLNANLLCGRRARAWGSGFGCGIDHGRGGVGREGSGRGGG